jgi:DHA1 family multidrug resistance protein-like MFS transporter
VSDSMLNPFFPQYFSSVLGVDDPRHVGYYIAACSLVVLLAFPVWARIARRVALVRLLIGTQIAAGAFSLACSATTSVWPFWALSLAMLVCKASYLLIYPHILSLERKDNHLATVSLLAFVLYFGRIVSALLSGTVFELLDPRGLFVVMAVGDVVQTVLCAIALRVVPTAGVAPTAADAAPQEPTAKRARYLMYKLGAVMLVLYLSSYISEPFFSAYWTAITTADNKIISGAVYAVPGIAALCALYANARARKQTAIHTGIASAVILATAGLALQLTGQPVAVVIGRGLFGWAIFQSMVRLDVVMFRFSAPDAYAVDFSTVSVYQGTGLLIASYAAGVLVSGTDSIAPFVVAIGGFVATVALYFILLHPALRRVDRDAATPSADVAALHPDGTAATHLAQEAA